MVIAPFAVVLGPTVTGVRVRSGVVPMAAVVVSVVLLPGAVLVMCERHALRPRDCGNALGRYGQGQQKHSKKAEETFRHRRAL
jgi:hypothetical protein